MPAIAPHKTATTDKAWDAGANEKRLKADQSADYYKREYAWYDADADTTKKAAYKFPHHEVSADGEVGDANTRACSAVIGALNGGRGGTKIPSADRQGVYNHAAKHLKDAGKDVPELKTEAQVDAEYKAAIERMGKAGSARKFERRAYDFELRAIDDGEPCIDGHAAVFNQTADLGWFRETVKPGAFRKTIVEDDIRALFNHNPDYVLGRNTADTLSLTEDEQGLRVRIVPPDTQLARDLMTSIRRGDISQASIGFYARGYEITRSEDGVWDRALTDIMLFDVSPVTYPAYEGTDMSVRSAEEIFNEFRNGPDKPAISDEEWKRESEHRRRLLQLAD